MKVLLFARSQAALDVEQPVIAAEGFGVICTTDYDEALQQLESGNVHVAIIGGGITGEARERIFAAANGSGATVIEGHLGRHVPAVRSGFDPSDASTAAAIEQYIRREILPEIRRLS